MLDAMPATVTLRTLAPARFRCSGCGHCCRAFVVGPLDDAFLQGLAALDLSVTGIAGPYVDGFTEPNGREVRFLTARAGRCVFLTAQDRCALHEHFGPEAKPLGCRTFPLVARWSGSELRVGLSPECQGLRHSVDDPDAPTVASQAQLAAREAGPPPAAPATADEAGLVAVADLLRGELWGRGVPPIEEGLAAVAALGASAADAYAAAAHARLAPDADADAHAHAHARADADPDADAHAHADARADAHADADAGAAPAPAPRDMEHVFIEAALRRPPVERQDHAPMYARLGAALALLAHDGWALPLPALPPAAELLWRSALCQELFVGRLLAQAGLVPAVSVLL
ncbi:MAG TPA: YkgJ family cysteine cluster protein, partial [Myxococcota bacterium]|nr:YkgJ family cysteine cluster protein [Myxococcota bacterium]